MSVLESLRLTDRTAIVTGGSRGIGRAITTGLAEMGATVVIASRSHDAGREAADSIEQETGASITFVETDVTKEADVEQLITETVREFGGLDILVNNAGTSVPMAAEEMPLDHWNHTLAVNLTGPFLCSKHAYEPLAASDSASIVNVSSMSAFIANYPERHADYQASKAGLEGLKTQLASEWATDGIRVNNIAPGYVETEMLDVTAEKLQTWRDATILGDLGDPEDIAGLAVYLASDASQYMTGETVVIDGGYTVR